MQGEGGHQFRSKFFHCTTSSTPGKTMTQSVIARIVVSLRVLQASLRWLLAELEGRCRGVQSVGFHATFCPRHATERAFSRPKAASSAPVFCRGPSSHVGSGCCLSAGGGLCCPFFRSSRCCTEKSNEAHLGVPLSWGCGHDALPHCCILDETACASSRTWVDGRATLRLPCFLGGPSCFWYLLPPS